MGTSHILDSLSSPPTISPYLTTTALLGVLLALFTSPSAAIGPNSAAPVAADEWASWRGPYQNGFSPASNLISSWSVGGDNQIWRRDLIGRSTPVVFDGRVCANGRRSDTHETVACWSAESGDLLWQRDYIVYNTTVPYARVGWGGVAADTETGYLYTHTVDGLLACLDKDGETVWEIRLGETFGRTSGYGGRTHTPIIDEDRVMLGLIGTSWGEFGPPRHRFYAFDKHDGRVVWTSNPSEENPKDMNTQATPIVTEIAGQRLMIGGAADGWIYALKARTGELVWKYQLSKRGINTAVVVADNVVYASHSEENLDGGPQGRVVAINATGNGIVTDTHEIWRTDEITVGFASPLLHDGVLYLLDNSANLLALDTATGNELWSHNVGTVGKSSPVWADGKIFVTEVNGNFVILKPGSDGAIVLDTDRIDILEEDRPAEIYSSPAIAYGRIYFTTETGIFCLGDPTQSFSAAASSDTATPEMAPVGAAAHIAIVVPTDAVANSGERVTFAARVFDGQGRYIGTRAAEWSLQNLSGSLSPEGAFIADPDAGNQAGHIVATIDDLTARARLRVSGPLPWAEDFSSGQKPRHWIGAGRFATTELGDEPVLHKPPAAAGLDRSVIYTGPESTSKVTVQIDLLGTRQGRRRPDGGVVNSGYTLDLMGNHQRVQVRSWASELRMAQQVPFEWNMDTWYTAKLRVDQAADSAIVRGKIWPRGQPEPTEWTITVQDPSPIRHGAPGIYGYSPVDLYFDNYKVTVNE